MKKDITPAPLQRVKHWKQTMLGVYDKLDALQNLKKRGTIEWPDYCELPIGVAASYLLAAARYSPMDASAVAAELTACWMWRRNKVIYSFDRDLAAALVEQAADIKDTDTLPTDLLFNLPYPCIYIQTPISPLGDKYDGFWVWIEYDFNTQTSELRIQWLLADGKKSIPCVLHLAPGKTLKDCKADTMQTIQQHLNLPVHLPSTANLVLEPLQLVLYLLAENADVTPKSTTPTKSATPTQEKEPSSGTPRIVRDQYKEIKPNDVGVYIGAALRKARQSSESAEGAAGSAGNRGGAGTPRRAHLRRGHWHHYWYGSKGERRLKLKWTAPMVIHAEQGEIGTVIVPVKPEK